MSHIRKKILLYATLVITVIPIFIYFSFIHAYGINVLYWDEWSQIPILKSALDNKLNMGLLWAQHNENRMFIPNLIFLMTGLIFKVNSKHEMYIGAFLLLLSFFLIIKFYKKNTEASTDKLINISLMAFLFFSLNQIEDTLWGFQLAWYLVYSCSLFAIYYLFLSVRKNKFYLLISIFLSIIASFSSLQGLLMWPTGLIILMLFRKYYKLNVKNQIVYWIIASILSIATYFYGFQFQNTGGTSTSYGLTHPIQFVGYFLTLIGSVVPLNDMSVNMIIGFIILITSIVLLIDSRSNIGDNNLMSISLIIFGIFFDLTVSLGRVGFGLTQAFSSRYTLFTDLIIIGLVIYKWRDFQIKNKLFRLVILSIAVLTVFTSYSMGYNDGPAYKSSRLMDLNILLNDPRNQTNVTDYVYPNYNYFYSQYSFLRNKKLNVFQNSTTFSNELSSSVPYAFKAAEYEYPNFKESLNQLWSVYISRPDLEKTFPKSQSNFTSNILSWAINYGVTIDGDKYLLKKYSKDYVYIYLSKFKHQEMHILPSFNRLLSNHQKFKMSLFVLSYVYNSRSDLQSAFKSTNLKFNNDIINWALKAGVKFDSDRNLLSPYDKEFIGIEKIINKG